MISEDFKNEFRIQAQIFGQRVKDFIRMNDFSDFKPESLVYKLYDPVKYPHRYDEKRLSMMDCTILLDFGWIDMVLLLALFVCTKRVCTYRCVRTAFTRSKRVEFCEEGLT